MKTTTSKKADAVEPIVIVLDGKRIYPPFGFKYRGKWRNRFLPDDSAHYWMNGYATWRPTRSVRVFVRR